MRTNSWMCSKSWTGIALVCLMPLIGDSSAVAVGQPAPAGSTERYVRYGFTVQNETGQMVPEAELWVCAPLKETSLQRVLDLKTSPPCEQRTDELGNHLLRITFSNVPPYAVRLVTVETTLAMNAEPAPIEMETDRFLRAEPMFEYDAADFGRLAPEFSAGESGQTARAIFDWVRDYLQDVGYDGTDRGALYALAQRKGDCTEYATLFAALCRRAGIPARAMGGYLVGRNAILDPAAFHNWAEFYLDGRWHLADPQAGIFREKEDQYLATRVLGESSSPLGNSARFRSVGQGLKIVMGKP